MKLSLCIATYNEQQNIHYPLASAYDLVDEVIIVDGGSADKTVEKAKSYGNKVKVFIENNPPMFHINKQKALDRAKGEWILQLDADEALSEELKDEIKSVISNQQSVISDQYSVFGEEQKTEKLKTDNRQPKTAFWLPRKNFFLTRFLTKGGQYPDYTIRLYRNGVARFPCKTVHENVEIINPNFQETRNKQIPNNKSQITIGYLENPILHYADPDFSRYLKRWDRYTTLEAKELSKKIHLPSSIFHLPFMFIDYFIVKPTHWFFLTYFRHLGFLDGFPGFVFALFSSIRFWAIYVKWWQKQHMQRSSHK